MMKLLFTKVSSNRKTGPIPVSMTSRETCFDGCPLKKSGCYGDGGPIAIHWNRISNGGGIDWSTFVSAVRKDIYPGQLWRHNQVGDLPQQNNRIDSEKLAELVTANKGKRGFTYTHHAVLENQADAETVANNRKAIAEANANGFTVNLSGNSLAHADKLLALGIAPVTAIVASATKQNVKTPAGNRVVICPAATKENVNCARCGLCQRSKRDYVIAFPAHGVSVKKVEAVAEKW